MTRKKPDSPASLTQAKMKQVHILNHDEALPDFANEKKQHRMG
ncbi:hypothetical protein [Methylobacter sp.]|nr:hypothetical protein [Methylobacter sp.]